jgi:hypothetical protein
VTICVLPDDVFLQIFGFHLEYSWSNDDPLAVDDWHTLAHVCQRWRRVVFDSPRRLNLRLLCNPVRSVEKMLDIWPDLPIFVYDGGSGRSDMTSNLTAALEQRHRVCHIDLRIPSSLFDIFSAAM